MSAQLWLNSYKPSLNNGSYGGYLYSESIKFYPKQLSHYLALKWDPYNRNNEYSIRNKFEKTLKHNHFNIDVWHSYLQKFTFDTKFIDIPPKYAHSITKFYRYRYCKTKIESLHINDVNNLRELQQLLDKEIKICIEKWYNNNNDYNENDKGVFIRFSNRSPKDGHKVYKDYQINDNEEKKVREKSLSEQEMKDIEEDPNTVFIEFCRQSAKDLFCDNSLDAMELILSSERVFTDLLTVINAHKWPYKYQWQNKFSLNTKYNNDELKWNEEEWEICRVSIAIRKWDVAIRDDLEFRCFVYDKQLTAISQYNHYCYFKELGDNALFVNAIKNKICNYFYQNIVELIPYFNYVIDIAVYILDEDNKENMNGLETIVIELNPFEETTGAALYSWRNDENQLKYGKEVEIRVHHKNVLSKDFVHHYLSDFAKYSVEKPWFEILDEIEQQLLQNQSDKHQHNNNKKSDCLIL